MSGTKPTNWAVVICALIGLALVAYLVILLFNAMNGQGINAALVTGVSVLAIVCFIMGGLIRLRSNR